MKSLAEKAINNHKCFYSCSAAVLWGFSVRFEIPS